VCPIFNDGRDVAAVRRDQAFSNAVSSLSTLPDLLGKEERVPKLIYQIFGGETREVEVPDGTSVMEGAVRNGVPGIDGDCGGACACATCHVYVPDAWLEKLEPQSEMERSMLEFAENVTPNSRLGCQIKLVGSLDGLELMLPESQH
jgi:2Fe-2S ferredoxin